MKISELIHSLQAALQEDGDIEVAYPNDMGNFEPVLAASTHFLFRHDAYEVVYSPTRLFRQSKNEHSRVLVLKSGGSYGL